MPAIADKVATIHASLLKRIFIDLPSDDSVRVQLNGLKTCPPSLATRNVLSNIGHSLLADAQRCEISLAEPSSAFIKADVSACLLPPPTHILVVQHSTSSQISCFPLLCAKTLTCFQRFTSVRPVPDAFSFVLEFIYTQNVGFFRSLFNISQLEELPEFDGRDLIGRVRLGQSIEVNLGMLRVRRSSKVSHIIQDFMMEVYWIQEAERNPSRELEDIDEEEEELEAEDD
ncbi:hypothetical protein DL96DRAFT_1708969 [Flagelloscypha sp. PMI_526]|nr:hypothetical protein DL96DRAFT_1708969 [Flagelloscypha sp. PMI_526]